MGHWFTNASLVYLLQPPRVVVLVTVTLSEPQLYDKEKRGSRANQRREVEARACYSGSWEVVSELKAWKVDLTASQQFSDAVC